jgi:hypothetical protein
MLFSFENWRKNQGKKLINNVDIFGMCQNVEFWSIDYIWKCDGRVVYLVT